MEYIDVRDNDGQAVQQLDGDFIPGRESFSGANYFERNTQRLHLVRINYS